MKITKEQFPDIGSAEHYRRKTDEALKNLNHARLWCPINSVMYGELSKMITKLYEMSLTEDAR